MGLVPSMIASLAFTIVEAVIFLFVLIATPEPQARYGASCTTLWATKYPCGGTISSITNSDYACTRMRNNMNGGAAFAIISIVVTILAIVFGILMLCSCGCFVALPLIFSALAVITILISWACVADVHNSQFCGVIIGSFSSGFGLMVTAWVLQVINTGVAVLIMVLH